MPIQYKINILEKLEKRGYNAYRLRKEQILSQATIENLRKNGYVSFEILGRICEILKLQPADIIEYIPDDDRINPDPKDVADYLKNKSQYEQWLSERDKHE